MGAHHQLLCAQGAPHGHMLPTVPHMGGSADSNSCLQATHGLRATTAAAFCAGAAMMMRRMQGGTSTMRR